MILAFDEEAVSVVKNTTNLTSVVGGVLFLYILKVCVAHVTWSYFSLG